MQPTLNPKQTSGGEDWLCQREKQLLSCLDIYPVTIDEIVRSSGLPPGEIHSLLLSLELKGMVKQTPGQQYGLMVSADK
jgi:DNA processing protein